MQFSKKFVILSRNFEKKKQKKNGQITRPYFSRVINSHY